MPDDYTFTYDPAAKRGVIKIAKTGEELAITNISAEQATRWEKEKAAEFVKRHFRMSTPTAQMTRED